MGHSPTSSSQGYFDPSPGSASEEQKDAAKGCPWETNQYNMGKAPFKKKELDSKNNAGGVKSRFNQLSQQDLPAEMISRRHCN